MIGSTHQAKDLEGIMATRAFNSLIFLKNPQPFSPSWPDPPAKTKSSLRNLGLLILLNTKKKEKNRKETSLEITHDILSNLL
jgi:hypothetical protein